LASNQDIVSVNWKPQKYIDTIIGFVVFLVLILVVSVPQFKVIYESLISKPFLTQELNWDEQNNIVWQYFAHIGLRPFIDFFYPYAGRYFVNLTFPYGQIVYCFNNVLLDILLLLSLHAFFGERLTKTVLERLIKTAASFIIINLTVISVINHELIIYRYMKPIILLALSFSVVQDREQRYICYILALAVIHCLFFEPLTLIMTTPGFAFLILIEGLKTNDWWLYIKQIFRVYAPTLILIIIFVTGLAATGYLNPVLSFYLNLGDLSAYANSEYLYNFTSLFLLSFGSPSSILVYTGLAFWLCSLLAGYSIFNHIISGAYSRYYRFVFVMMFASLLLGNKILIRFAESLVDIQYTLLVTSIFFILISKEMAKDRYFKTITIVCLIINLMVVSGNNVYHQLQLAYANARNSVSSLFFLFDLDLQETHKIMLKQWYAAERTSDFSFQNELIVSEAVKHLDLDNEYLYVLGDAPILHVFTQTKPIRHIETYSSSPLPEQNEIVSLIQSLKPPIIWNRRFRQTIDNIPLEVRNPVVLGYVVSQYQPALSVNEYTVLLPNTASDFVDIDFWRTELSSEIDLGYLPRFSNISRLPILPEYTPEAIPTVYIEISSEVASNQPTMSFICQIDDVEYLVKFNVTPNDTLYGFRLDRIWFVQAMPRDRWSEIILKFPEGVRGKFEWRKETQIFLY